MHLPRPHTDGMAPWTPRLKLTDDDFTLFGLPPKQVQDRVQIDALWRDLQARVHPDRFAADGAAAQRVAMQWAVRVNEAYRRLKDPLLRGAYLCELRGTPIQAEDNTAMPGVFLMQQMQWREALDEAVDLPAVQALEADVATHEQALHEDLQLALDVRDDAATAAATVRALMFVSRFRQDIAKRIEALDA